MTQRPIAFAVPGDINTVTGGYIYERRLMEGLRGVGHDLTHIELPATFPDQSPKDATIARAQLCDVAPDTPLIIDGLAYGSIATADLAQVRAPMIAMIHHPLAKENGLDEARRAHLFRTERDNLALAQHVLVPSPHTAKILMTEYCVAPDLITIARPGTDRPTGGPALQQPPLILSVGIQALRKGHDVLLRALAEITDIPWQAVIAGSAHDTAHANDLTALMTSLGLHDRVDFAGLVTGPRLFELYRNASIFALATRYEGYGIVFDEALAHGLPIVSCATGAVPDTVPADAGLLVPPDTPKAFAGALRSLLSEPDRRESLAKAAQRAGQNLPSWQETARITSQAINTALQQAKKHG